jgi:hypothetical protein
MAPESMQRSCAKYYDHFLLPVEKCVHSYESYLKQTWPNHESLILQRQRRWVQPFGPVPYYLPFWLGEVFPKVSQEQLHATAVANVFLYHYYTLKDDVLDKASTSPNLDVLVADAILGEGLRLFASTGANNERFFADLSRYMVDAIQAEAHLQSIHSQTPYTKIDIKAMGRKASLAKVSAAALANITQNQNILPVLECSLDDMAVGIQLLDDLRDWKEDLHAGRFTYPLWLARTTAPELDAALFGDYIPRSAVAGQVLAQLERYCSRAADHFAKLHAVNVSEFLNNLVEGSKRIRTLLDTRRLSWEELEQKLMIYMQGGS